jgi:CheY-like chemotaxis protein
MTVEVLQARSGVESLDLLLAHDVALAIIDVQMPGMDGFELAELMRGAKRTRHVPIILVTAGVRDQHRLFRATTPAPSIFSISPSSRASLPTRPRSSFSCTGRSSSWCTSCQSGPRRSA